MCRGGGSIVDDCFGGFAAPLPWCGVWVQQASRVIFHVRINHIEGSCAIVYTNYVFILNRKSAIVTSC
jgi:hypothetical protein